MTALRQAHIGGLFLFSIIAWGLAWPISKIGLAYLSPLWFVAIRLSIGTIVMLILAFVFNKLTLPTRHDWPLIVAIGLLQIGLFVLFINIGLYYMPPGHAALFTYVTPLWVIPLSILFFNERPKRMHWLGLMASMGGLMILISPWEMNWSDHHVIFGVIMLLTASLAWALSLICARYLPWHKSPTELTPWQLLMGTLLVLLFAIIKEPAIFTHAIHWNKMLILSLCYTGIVVAGLSQWTGVIVSKELSPIVFSLGLLLVPLISLGCSIAYM